MDIIEEVNIKIHMRGKLIIVNFKIVKEDVQAILGRKACSSSLNFIRHIHAIKKTEKSMKEIKKELFNGLGYVKGYEYDIKLKEGKHLRIYSPHRISFSLMKEVKKQLDKMIRIGIIKPVSEPTPAT